MFEYKTEIEIYFNHFSRMVPVILVCDIQDEEVEVKGMIYPKSKEQNSNYMIGLINDIYHNYDFEHMRDEILDAADANKKAEELQAKIEAREDRYYSEAV